MMMVIGNKQHLSKIWSSMYEKVKQQWGWAKKSIAYKKALIALFTPFRPVLVRKSY